MFEPTTSSDSPRLKLRGAGPTSPPVGAKPESWKRFGSSELAAAVPCRMSETAGLKALCVPCAEAQVVAAASAATHQNCRIMTSPLKSWDYGFFRGAREGLARGMAARPRGAACGAEGPGGLQRNLKPENAPALPACRP